MSTLTKTLVAEWQNPSTKEMLKNRIRSNSQSPKVETTDQAILE